MVHHFGDGLFEDGGCLSDGKRRVQVRFSLRETRRTEIDREGFFFLMPKGRKSWCIDKRIRTGDKTLQ